MRFFDVFNVALYLLFIVVRYAFLQTESDYQSYACGQKSESDE